MNHTTNIKQYLYIKPEGRRTVVVVVVVVVAVVVVECLH